MVYFFESRFVNPSDPTEPDVDEKNCIFEARAAFKETEFYSKYGICFFWIILIELQTVLDNDGTIYRSPKVLQWKREIATVKKSVDASGFIKAFYEKFEGSDVYIQDMAKIFVDSQYNLKNLNEQSAETFLRAQIKADDSLQYKRRKMIKFSKDGQNKYINGLLKDHALKKVNDKDSNENDVQFDDVDSKLSELDDDFVAVQKQENLNDILHQDVIVENGALINVIPEWKGDQNEVGKFNDGDFVEDICNDFALDADGLTLTEKPLLKQILYSEHIAKLIENGGVDASGILNVSSEVENQDEEEEENYMKSPQKKKTKLNE